MNTDILIIGSGPAGIQAGIYSIRRNMSVTILGKLVNSNLYDADIENYLGFEYVEGSELLVSAKKQAEKFGVNFLQKDVVEISKTENNTFHILSEDNLEINAKAIIICTGASKTKLGIKGEKEYKGKGVSYCVDCDGFLFKGKKVVVIGNGSAAAKGVISMAGYVRDISFICEELNVSENLEKEIFDNPKINVMQNNWIKEICGDGDFVKKVILKNDDELSVDGVFVELGAKGVLELFGSVGLELYGPNLNHIKVDNLQAANIPGIFAAGDVCGVPYQVAKAVGTGCVAGISASEYLIKS
ncbi:NAD(P)/FAD-dependent oxidoreductase [bacterium]